MGTLTELIEMSECRADILNLSKSALNSLKKLDLVWKILDLKGKVIVNADLYKLFNQISKLTETIDQNELENKKLRNWSGCYIKC